MNRYNYKFTWNDKKSGNYNRKYMEGSSTADAIAQFEEHFGISVQDNKIEVVRLKGNI